MTDNERTAKVQELAEFISGRRKSQEKFWWVGDYDPDTESPLVVSTSLRGFLDKGMWLPMKDELGASCCADFTHRSSKEDLSDAYEFMRHCTEVEHIRQMLVNRTDDQLEAEYNFMLEVAMESLAEKLG
jgi:hypothetical protein